MKSTGFINFDDYQSNKPGRDDDRGQGHLFVPHNPCHMTHPTLEIGGGKLIGGNCRDHERHKDVDIYVALDYAQAHGKFEPGKEAPQAIYYPITNMKTPNRPDKFIALVDYLVGKLAEGKTIHVGCIGGHGRTGLVLASIVARLGIAGEDNDAIGWVRKHYCKKAVETHAQAGFVAVNFGAKLPPDAGYQKKKPKNKG